MVIEAKLMSYVIERMPDTSFDELVALTEYSGVARNLGDRFKRGGRAYKHRVEDKDLLSQMKGRPVRSWQF
jgi:hypothetical protein